MVFDRLLYIDRLKEAGIAEPVARAHADALKDSLMETFPIESQVRGIRQ